MGLNLVQLWFAWVSWPIFKIWPSFLTDYLWILAPISICLLCLPGSRKRRLIKTYWFPIRGDPTRKIPYYILEFLSTQKKPLDILDLATSSAMIHNGIVYFNYTNASPFGAIRTDSRGSRTCRLIFSFLEINTLVHNIKPTPFCWTRDFKYLKKCSVLLNFMG